MQKIIRKQLQSVGCPLWDDKDVSHVLDDHELGIGGDIGGPKYRDRPNPNNLMHIRVYNFCTDCGPDEAKAVKDIHAAIENDIYCWSLRCPCLLHQAHLIVTSSVSSERTSDSQTQSPQIPEIPQLVCS